jgi:hypothetical protein
MWKRRWHENESRQRPWRLHERGSVIVRLLLAAGVALTLAPLAATPRWRPAARDTSTAQAPAPAKVAVTLEAVATSRTGATDKPRATVTRTVAVGDRVPAGFVAGGADGSDLCELMSLPGSSGGGGRFRWQVDATVVSADASTVTLALAWQRSAGEAAGVNRDASIADQRTVRLRADDVHVLDLVQADAGSPSSCASVLIRVRAARAEPPMVARRWVTYDLWLTYEDAGGEQTAGYLRLGGAEDAPVTAEFVPLRWGLNGARTGAAAQAAVSVAVRGTARGRCRADGIVDLALDTVRVVAIGEARLTGSGRKEFAESPGDTVAVEIPNPAASLTAQWTTVAHGPQPWAPGVQGSADAVTVDFGEFFRSSRLRVLVSGRCW